MRISDWSSDVCSSDLSVSDIQRNDPGFIADRASWLRDNAQSPAARALLAQPHRLSKRPASVASWYKVLLTNARAAAADGQYALAYQIASQVDDAYPDGVDLEADRKSTRLNSSH